MSVSRFIKAPLHKRWTNNTFGRILQRSCTTVHSATSNEPKPYDLPSHARVVICGGGVTGTSIAYHLAERGWNDVVLLEQGK
jgi:pyruvate dehydrogenase phosphatase regulatory subunit